MQVVWTKRAVLSLQQVSDYISANFGERVLANFYQTIQSWTGTLSKMSLMGKVEPLLSALPTEYRSVVIDYHSKLIYSLDADCIVIHDVWDTRREPQAIVNGLDK